MRRQYDDFTQLKIKDMSKSISDMTYKYINPETQAPTKVPPTHYEKILDQVTEKYMSDITSRQFLTIMYTQLSNLKKEDEKYFNQALLCMDMGLNPKDLRIDEQIAIEYTNDYIEDKKSMEKKNFHFLNEDIVQSFDEAKNNPALQAQVVRESNRFEDRENDMFNHKDYNDREIRDYTESVYFGLSLRQFIFSILACGMAVVLYFVFRPYFGIETLSWLCILGAAPFAAIGFIKYNGMNAEEFLLAYIRSEFLTPKELVFNPTNYYYEILKGRIGDEKKDENNKKSIQTG